MDRVASVAALFVTFGLVAAYASPPTYARSQIDGLYVIPQEVRGYQNDRLELALREGANCVHFAACVARSQIDGLYLVTGGSRLPERPPGARAAR